MSISTYIYEEMMVFFVSFEVLLTEQKWKMENSAASHKGNPFFYSIDAKENSVGSIDTKHNSKMTKPSFIKDLLQLILLYSYTHDK